MKTDAHKISVPNADIHPFCSKDPHNETCSVGQQDYYYEQDPNNTYLFTSNPEDLTAYLASISVPFTFTPIVEPAGPSREELAKECVEKAAEIRELTEELTRKTNQFDELTIKYNTQTRKLAAATEENTKLKYNLARIRDFV